MSALFVLVGGVPRPVTAADLARWMAMGRGHELPHDLIYAVDILAGMAVETPWPAPPRPCPRLSDVGGDR